MSTTDARAYVRANKTLFVTLLLVLGMGVANAAWTSAPGNPTSNNVAEPLNVGSSPQTKVGFLSVTNGIGTPWMTAGGGDYASNPFAIQLEKGLGLVKLNTAGRNNLTANGVSNPGRAGLTIYNVELKQIETFNGLNWIGVATSTTGTSTPSSGINLTNGCFAVNNVCVGGGGGGGGGGGATTTIEQGPAVRATFSTANSAMPLTTIPFNVNTGLGDYVIGTQWNSTSNGSFSPKVAGQYLVTVHVEVGECTTAGCSADRGSPGEISAPTTVTFDVKRNGTSDRQITLPLEMDKGYDTYTYGQTRNVRNIIYYPKTLEFSHLVNLNANDTITVGALSNRTMYAIGSNNQSYVTVVRVGSPLFFTPTVYAPVNVPTGGIIYFDSTCPSGWSDYTQLQGRYAVGAASGIGTTVGTALSSGENRPAGQHSHAFNDYFYSQATGGYDTGGTSMPYPTGSLTYTGNGTDSGTGLVAGTNAPYIQLRPCRKD